MLNVFGGKPDDNSTLRILKYTNYTANFEKIPPPIPAEYWIPLYGVIISSIVGWSIPSIIGWLKTKNQGRRLHQFHRIITYLYRDDRLDQNDTKDLDNLRKEITGAYAKGKISEQQYGNLKNEISLLYEEIYDKRINSVSNKADKDNGILLSK